MTAPLRSNILALRIGGRYTAKVEGSCGASHALRNFRDEWGTMAPRPLDGEATRDYKVRLLNEFKQNSPVWRDVDMAQIARLPAEVFNRAESQIYADSMAASAHPAVPDGEIRTITRRMKGDATGRMETVHFGRPSAWMSQFAHRKMHARINPFPNRSDR
jgi:hypothetical protein